MVTEGVDYSFARPSPSGLYAAGKRFAVRYGGPGSAGKHLTASELRSLKAAGVDVVANAEGEAGAFKTAAVGRSWAASAQAAFRALGMPVGRPIYFSVDWDAGSKDFSGIDSALRAAAGVIGADLVGVYGSYDVIAHCKSAGTARWLWQTYAWSGGRQHSAANLYQYKNGVTIAGGDCDLTRALTVDYGQWDFFPEDVVTQPAYTEAQMKAFPWQFSGNPLPAGKSTATILADIHAATQDTLAAVQALATPTVDVEALADAIVSRLPQGSQLTRTDLIEVLNAASISVPPSA